MGGYVCTIFILIAVVRIIKEKTVSIPDVLFLLEWALISGLASLRLYDFYKVENKTWLMVLIGGLAFSIGVRLSTSRIRFVAGHKSSRKIEEVDRSKNIKQWYWVFAIITLMVRVYYLHKTRTFIGLGYSLAEIRGAYYGSYSIAGFEYTTSGIMVLVRKIFSTINMLVVAEGVYLSIFSEKKDYKPIIISFLITVMNSLSDGGRFGLAYLLIEIFVCLSIEGTKLKTISDNYKQRKRKKRSWIFYLALGVVLVGLIFGVTAMRGRTGDIAIEQLYTYMCGDVILLDSHVNFLESSPLSYGFSGLYGITTIIFPILHYAGLSYPHKYLEVGSIFERAIIPQRIGNHSTMNAFVTPYYYLYADFRWFGIILGMFIFGTVCGGYYKSAIKEKNHINIIMYLIISQMIFKTIHQYFLTSSDYVLALLFAFVVKNIKIKASTNR